MSLEAFLSATQSVCPECLRRIDAEKLARGDEVILRKECPEHGRFQTVLWRGGPSYTTWRSATPRAPSYPCIPFVGGGKGCPAACGLCAEHRQHTCTALIEVTQRCDLKCAYCFADGGHSPGEDSDLDAVRNVYERLLDACNGPCNVQLSGGEPTLREDLPQIVEVGRSLGFDFIQVNTNGLRIARGPDYARRLKDAGVGSLFLQFDGLEDPVYVKLRGKPLLNEKRLAVEHCARHGLPVVLVPTLVPGVNDHQIGDIIRFGIGQIPVVRGIHFQPVSYFGRYPAPPKDAERITLPEVLRAIQTQTRGKIRAEDFKPPGCENAHCSFHGNFVLVEDGELRAWTRHAPGAGCCEPGPAADGAVKARRFVSRFWGAPPRQTDAAKTDLKLHAFGEWDRFLERARTHSFCISGMAFQDAWSLDLDRLMDCCIHVAHLDGRLIPFCAYNLTDRRGRSLYRSNGSEGRARRH